MYETENLRVIIFWNLNDMSVNKAKELKQLGIRILLKQGIIHTIR